MPLYLFTNQDETETVDVFFHMNDEKRFFGPDGKEWRRVFTVPGAAIDSSSKIDPYSKRDFVNKTANKKGSVGNLLDEAKSLSLQRAEKEGRDPIKEKFLEKYKQDTGKEYRSLDKNQTIKSGGITVDFSK
jgi:hypothetical protein